MRGQGKKADLLRACRRRTQICLSEQELRNCEPPSEKDVDVGVADDSQKDSSTSLKSLRKAKKNHKRKLAVGQMRKTSLKDAAHVYLQLWHTDRSSWRFRKKIQYWILKNMYSKDQVIYSLV